MGRIQDDLGELIEPLLDDAMSAGAGGCRHSVSQPVNFACRVDPKTMNSTSARRTALLFVEFWNDYVIINVSTTYIIGTKRRRLWWCWRWNQSLWTSTNLARQTCWVELYFFFAVWVGFFARTTVHSWFASIHVQRKAIIAKQVQPMQPYDRERSSDGSTIWTSTFLAFCTDDASL